MRIETRLTMPSQPHHSLATSAAPWRTDGEFSFPGGSLEASGIVFNHMQTEPPQDLAVGEDGLSRLRTNATIGSCLAFGVLVLCMLVLGNSASGINHLPQVDIPESNRNSRKRGAGRQGF